jgi:hypothetical protein
MKHFNIWQWADYARGLSAAPERAAMDAHLSSGCARCARTASTFRRVTALAGLEPGNEPPEHAIRYAKAVYSLFRPETTSLPRLLARLVHDSMREPLPAGSAVRRPAGVRARYARRAARRPAQPVGRRRGARLPDAAEKRRRQHDMRPLRRVSAGIHARAGPAALSAAPRTCPAPRNPADPAHTRAPPRRASQDSESAEHDKSDQKTNHVASGRALPLFQFRWSFG